MNVCHGDIAVVTVKIAETDGAIAGSIRCNGANDTLRGHGGPDFSNSGEMMAMAKRISVQIRLCYALKELLHARGVCVSRVQWGPRRR